jgi:putative membrane protein
MISLATLLADYYGHMDGGDGGWMWLWGTIMMFTFIALIGVGIWAIVRSQSRDSSPRSTDAADATASARAILAERFARGEITPEEYRERLDHLRA